MPELPEVEVVRAGLEPAVTGATIDAVTVFEERSLRRHDGPSEDFVERLEGRSILAAVRRGKFLWLPLSPPTAPRGAPATPPKTQEIRHQSGQSATKGATGGESPAFSVPAEALVVHLGMSGQVLLRDVRQADDPLLRIRLDVASPASGPLRVDFVDQRIFGSMAIDRLEPTPDGRAAGFGWDAALIPGQVAHIARDPLDPAFSDRRFLDALAARRTGIKRALLDQGLISGIGNIYADEALWAARIHYDQPTATLSRARARTLLAEVRLVLGRALAEGGTSFDAQYVNVNGASGYFSHSLNAYGQHGKSCPRCGRPIIRESFMNRGSHFCPFCQRIRAAPSA
ncbi:bifunctional DNA-formamidopyrimidine glycosylase/DNA-(apurinic or apyrimidinic site) lyase [soil metagenome]